MNRTVCVSMCLTCSICQTTSMKFVIKQLNIVCLFVLKNMGHITQALAYTVVCFITTTMFNHDEVNLYRICYGPSMPNFAFSCTNLTHEIYTPWGIISLNSCKNSCNWIRAIEFVQNFVQKTRNLALKVKLSTLTT